MKKISIIGSNSFVAGYLINALVGGSYRVRLYGQTSPLVLAKGFEFEMFRLPLFPLNFESLLEEDFIIVTAAAGAQVGGQYNANEIFEINAFFPIKLLNFLNLHPNFKGAVVTFGSYFEIGTNQIMHPFTEEEVIMAKGDVPNDYCNSKRLLSRFISNKQLLVRHYHLFVTNIYGKNENENRLIPYLLHTIKNNKPVKLTSGLQWRQYLHVEDLVGVLCDIIDNDYPNGFYNFSKPEPLQIRDIIKYVFYVLDKKISDDMFGQTSRTDELMKVLLLNDTKMKATFKYQPKIDIKVGILKYFDNIKETN